MGDLLDDVSKEKNQNLRETTLLIEGLHCAACVWLIERAMRSTAGVRSAEVNLANRRLRLLWDQEQTPLSALLQKLNDIGYAAVPYTVDGAEEAAVRAGRSMLYRLGYAGFAFMNLMWLSVALWSGADATPYAPFIRFVEMALATPVFLYSGWPFLRGALKGIRAFVLTMDTPVALGATALYGYSSYVTLLRPQAGETYFDTMSAFIFVLLAGRYLEMNARSCSASATHRMLALEPRSARRIGNDGTEEIVSVKKIDIGDRVLIRPGERIPVDGTILEGKGGIDESMITGESVPVPRTAGDPVVAGSLSESGAYIVVADRRADDTFLRRMAKRLEKAQSSKAPAQRYADAVVPWFVGINIVLAGVTFYYWLTLGLQTALMNSVAVLVVTCPCALGLATPLAVAYSAGFGARHGIVVKDGAALEVLAKTTDVVFDKTGSLTEGEYRFRSLVTQQGVDEERLIKLAVSVQKRSEHPLASATLLEASARNIDFIPADDLVFHKGLGVEGKCGKVTIAVGSRRFFRQKGIVVPAQLDLYAAGEERRGMTTFFVAENGLCIGAMAFGDAVRDTASSAVARLQAENITVAVFTGDREAVAKAVTASLPPPVMVRAEMTPEEKGRGIEELKNEGRITVMVGDGVNDALALAVSDVGVALASGSDVSTAAADLLILGGRLERIPDAISLGRGMMLRIRQNLFISLAYNVIMVPLAMAGFVSPVVAAVAMPISSLAVILNASRVRMVSRKEEKWM